MTIDTNKRKTVSPGDTVTVKGKATPGSFMAFRAVDKSVLLMKEDTDISVKKVIKVTRIHICEYSISFSRQESEQDNNCKYSRASP